jgi:hypothetical protein
MAFSFKCSSCDEIHEGIPTFGADAPSLYYWMPEDERATRAVLSSDLCVIDNERFLVRGCIEIPVEGEEDPFVWGVWVDVSERDFRVIERLFGVEKRAHVGPFAGYLGSELPCYPDSTFNLHVVAHLRDDGIRPSVQVSRSPHALHAEQCGGISHHRLSEIYQAVMHGN